MKHTRTDPGCGDFGGYPRTRWQQWLFDRARGSACPTCHPTQGVTR